MLLALVRAQKPKVIWEVGTAAGGTLWALAAALRGSVAARQAMFVSIDLPCGLFSDNATIEPADLRALLREASGNRDLEVEVVRGDSATVRLPARRPDFVLIDGDHGYDGVHSDWLRYSPLVKAHGLVVLHDILPHATVRGVEVERLWGEIVAVPGVVTVELLDRGPYAEGWGGFGVVFTQ